MTLSFSLTKQGDAEGLKLMLWKLETQSGKNTEQTTSYASSNLECHKEQSTILI